jgi:hypothetical protein
LTGLGSGYSGFATVAVDAGAVWTLAGNNTIAAGTTLADAGSLSDTGSLANDGRITVVGGGLSLGAVGEDAGQHGAISLGQGGLAEFTGAVDAGQSFLFTDTTGTLRLDQPAGFAATISAFQTGDVIDLAHQRATALSFRNGVLRLTDAGTTVATLALAGDYTTSEFALSGDGAGGTRVTVTAAPPTELFRFVYVYADGAAYYTGTVADDGSLGYAAIAASGNPTIVINGLGTYRISDAGQTSASPGAVSVTQFFPSTNSGAGFTPLLTQQGHADGSAGLGSEADTFAVNGTPFAFSASLEPRPFQS